MSSEVMWELRDLWIGGSVVPWETIGLLSRSDSSSGHDERRVLVPGLELVFCDDGSFGGAGVAGWTFTSNALDAPLDVETSIDGIRTRCTSGGSASSPDAHRLDVIGVDHVVVMTGSLERTCAAITQTIGDPIRRIRDAGGGVRQGFHRSGEVIIEVVERPDLDPDSPASLWGLVLTVHDLDDVVAWLGPDVIGSPRDAVQSGRRISTFRPAAGLGVPLALMTPHVRP